MKRYREAATPVRVPSFRLPSFPENSAAMNVFELTRTLIDIESVTGGEKQVGDFLFSHLSPLAMRYSGHIERITAEPNRDNIFVFWSDPQVTLSTHMDTVPPFFTSGEDRAYIHGRGACDAKGIIAAMIAAAENLLASGTRNFALLFVVGEERNSAGARAAAVDPRGSKFLINGEPTENAVALGCKGALRYEITAHGKLAHSAYPELGHSAIHSLLDALDDIRKIPLPKDALLGPATLNIGTISGGRAPNVIADEARAEVMFRTVSEPAAIRKAVYAAMQGRAEAREVLHTPAMHLSGFDGLPTTVVAFTTDIPTFANVWGKPYLIGPGSIHAAHTAEERVEKTQLTQAVDIYARMVRQLLATGEASR
jgi:acetylornithine deacetylase